MDKFLKDSRNLLLQAEEVAKDVGYKEFVATKLGILCKLMGMYEELFSKMKVFNTSDLMTYLKNCNASDQDAVDNYFQFEIDWNAFVSTVDEHVSPASKFHESHKLEAGDVIDVDLEICNDTLNEADCKVVLMSFGPQAGCLRWISDTSVTFDMYSDQNRSLYNYFHFGWSFSKVWSTEPLTYYGFQLAKGEKLIETYKNVEDDPHQMGGDVILTKRQDRWVVTKVHRSRTSADRPTVSDIVASLNRGSVAK